MDPIRSLFEDGKIGTCAVRTMYAQQSGLATAGFSFLSIEAAWEQQDAFDDSDYKQERKIEKWARRKRALKNARNTRYRTRNRILRIRSSHKNCPTCGKEFSEVVGNKGARHRVYCCSKCSCLARWRRWRAKTNGKVGTPISGDRNV